MERGRCGGDWHFSCWPSLQVVVVVLVLLAVLVLVLVLGSCQLAPTGVGLLTRAASAHLLTQHQDHGNCHAQHR